MKFKERAEQLKKELPAVFLALKRKDTPWYAKISAIFTIGYALSPIDLIPDFIPVLGYLDDLIVLPMMVAVTIKAIPVNIMEQCRHESEQIWKNGKPKKWLYSIPVLSIWILVILLIIKKILF